MHAFRRFIRSLTSMAILTAFALLAVACSVVDDNDPDTLIYPIDTEAFELRFRICTRNIDATRAPDIEGDQEGTVAENFINLKDIHYYLFDKGGNFLVDITPHIDPDRSMAISSDYSLYEVVAKIGPDDTDYFKNHRTGTVDFYIMAFANYSGESGYSGVTLPDFKTDNTMSQIFGSPFTPVINGLPDTEKLMKAADKGDVTVRNCFPMSGLQRFSLSGTWFETMPGETPVDLTQITGKSLNMLRAMAKIEIIDRINLKPGEQYDDERKNETIRIASASIDGVMRSARVLPMQNQWKRNDVFETQQVENASIPAGSDSYVAPPALNADGSITIGNPEETSQYSLKFVADPTETLNREDHSPVYSCYIWEYLKPENIATDRLPYLTVTVSNPAQLKEDAPLQGVQSNGSATFHIPLTDDMSPSAKNSNPQQSFLRNHIYRYEISGSANDISIKWSVCPMDKQTAVITFN